MKIEKIEDKNLKVSEEKLKVTIENSEIKNEVVEVYDQNRKYFTVPGFRKGKIPFEIVIKYYGPEAFLDDAINNIINTKLVDAINEEIGEGKLLEILHMHPEKEADYDNDYTMEVEIATLFETDLKGYKGVKIDETELLEKIGTVDERVETLVNAEVEKNSRLVSIEDEKYKIKNGDTVELAFHGYIKDENDKDVMFEGGHSHSHELEIGSKSFIDGFEDQLIGMKLNEEKDVMVTFPEEYHAADLAGKDARFEVEILKISEKITPKANDDFAKDVGFDTLDEYKDSLKVNVEEQYEVEKEQYILEKAVNQIIEENKLDLSDNYIKLKAEHRFNDMNGQYLRQGIDLKQILGDTTELEKGMQDEVKFGYALNVIAKNVARIEKLETTEESKEKALEQINATYKEKIEMDELNQYPELEKSVEEGALFNEATKFIVDNVKLEKGKKKEVKKEDKEEK